MDLSNLIILLRRGKRRFQPPMTFFVFDKYGKDPFLILACCLLSLRSKDLVTWPVVQELFKYVRTPHELAVFPQSDLESIIHPVGFYRQKAKILIHVSNELINRFDGKVPSNEDDLLSIKGIGRKTANLVLGEGFGIPAICVDIHVHRISNRLGLVKTNTPEDTEYALKAVLSKENWIEWNQLLVTWGQNICTPILPKCSNCDIAKFCNKVDIKNYR